MSTSNLRSDCHAVGCKCQGIGEASERRLLHEAQAFCYASSGPGETNGHREEDILIPSEVRAGKGMKERMD